MGAGLFPECEIRLTITPDDVQRIMGILQQNRNPCTICEILISYQPTWGRKETHYVCSVLFYLLDKNYIDHDPSSGFGFMGLTTDSFYYFHSEDKIRLLNLRHLWDRRDRRGYLTP